MMCVIASRVPWNHTTSISTWDIPIVVKLCRTDDQTLCQRLRIMNTILECAMSMSYIYDANVPNLKGCLQRSSTGVSIANYFDISHYNKISTCRCSMINWRVNKMEETRLQCGPLKRDGTSRHKRVPTPFENCFSPYILYMYIYP